LVITKQKSSFLFVQTNWICPSEAQRFCEIDSDSGHWLRLAAIRVNLWKTWLEWSRVNIILNVTRVESYWPKIVTRVTLSSAFLMWIDLILQSFLQNQIKCPFFKTLGVKENDFPDYFCLF